MNVCFRLCVWFLLFSLHSAGVDATITWQPASTVSATGQNAGSPQVAIDQSGNMVSIWSQYDGSNYVIQGATFNGTVWSSPVPISSAGQNADLPQLSINASGKAVAVWSRFDGADTRVQSAITQTPTNAWSSPVDLSLAGSDAQNPQVGVDGNGNGVAIWTQGSPGGTTLITGAVLTGVAWGTPTSLSLAGESANMPKVAMNPSGQAIAVWRRCNGSNGIIQSAFYAPPIGWNQPGDLSTTGESAAIPQVGIDAEGNGIAVWRRFNGTNFIVQASTYSNGAWSSPIGLSADGSSADHPQIAVDSTGRAFATWSIQVDALDSLIQGSQSDTHTPSTWSPPTNFTSSTYASTSSVVINQTDVGVVWSIANCANQNFIQADSLTLTSRAKQSTTLFGPADIADEPKVAINNVSMVAAAWRGVQGGESLVLAAAGTFGPPSPMLPEICVEPSSGPVSGGTNVILMGEHLTGAFAVKFGTNPATSFTVVSDQEITAVSPAGVLGTVTVSVTTLGGTSVAQECNAFTYTSLPIPPPDICIDPATGPQIGGTVVTLTGSHLLEATDVSFGSVAALAFVVNSDYEIEAVAPPGAVGTVTVSVTTLSGTSSVASCNAYTYTTFPPLPPQICINPNTGPVTGGNLVTLTGTGLSGTNAVFFGTQPAAEFTILSDSQVEAIAPAGAVGTVTVTVTTPDGASLAEPCNAYTYTAVPPQIPQFCISPNEGPTTGGTLVTLSGVNLSTVTTVTFGSQPAGFIAIADNEIQAFAPPGTVGTVTVTAVNLFGSSSAEACNAYTYFLIPPSSPSVCIEPSSGPAAGGTSVVLTGTNLMGAISVNFGPRQASSFTVISDSQIVAVSPPGSGTVTVSVMTLSGTSEASPCNQFTYVSIPPSPPSVCISPNSGPAAGGTSVVLTGSNLTGAISVHFGKRQAASFTVISDSEIVAVSPPGSGKVTVSVTTPFGSSEAQACNQFTYVAVAPPSAIHVKQIKNHFATQTDLVNVVTWSKSPSPEVTSYRLYRNGKLIKKFSAHERLRFKDHNRKKGASTEYSVTALIGNNESEPATVVLHAKHS